MNMYVLIHKIDVYLVRVCEFSIYFIMVFFVNVVDFYTILTCQRYQYPSKVGIVITQMGDYKQPLNC
jgi:hypothetical protein